MSDFLITLKHAYKGGYRLTLKIMLFCSYSAFLSVKWSIAEAEGFRKVGCIYTFD